MTKVLQQRLMEAEMRIVEQPEPSPCFGSQKSNQEKEFDHQSRSLHRGNSKKISCQGNHVHGESHSLSPPKPRSMDQSFHPATEKKPMSNENKLNGTQSNVSENGAIEESDFSNEAIKPEIEAEGDVDAESIEQKLPQPVRLFVGQVPETMVEPHLTSLFQAEGVEVLDIAIIRDKHTSRHRHCAFITVPSREKADAAIDTFHNKKYLESMSNPMQVKEANQPKPKSSYAPLHPFHPGPAFGVGVNIPKGYFKYPGYGQMLPLNSFNTFNSFIPANYMSHPQMSVNMQSFPTYGGLSCASSPYMYGYMPPIQNVATNGYPPANYSVSAVSPTTVNKQTTCSVKPDLQSFQAPNVSTGTVVSETQTGSTEIKMNHPQSYPGSEVKDIDSMTPRQESKLSISSPSFVHSQSKLTNMMGDMSPDISRDMLNGSLYMNGDPKLHQTSVNEKVASGPYPLQQYDSSSTQLSSQAGVIHGFNGHDYTTEYQDPQSMFHISHPHRLQGNLMDPYSHPMYGYGPEGNHPRQSTYVEGPPGANLFVNNLPESVNDDDLLSMFESHGNILSYKVFVDKYTHKSKGFGFVSFASVIEARDAIRGKNGLEIEKDRRLIVELKRSKRLKFSEFY